MSNRIKDFATTATASAADDYIPQDGATNGSRKRLARDFLKETHAFALSDETTALTTGLKLTIPSWPHANTFLAIFTEATTAPTGASLIVDVKVNTVSILSTKPAIAVSEFDSRDGTDAVLSTTSIALGAKVEFFVDQIGSTIAGAGLKIFIEATRT